MKAYFALLLALVAFVIAPMLNTVVHAMGDARKALADVQTELITTTTVPTELIPAVRIER
jgi:hypothetical protein